MSSNSFATSAAMIAAGVAVPYPARGIGAGRDLGRAEVEEARDGEGALGRDRRQDRPGEREG
ncbi:hypothetical protein LCGC14_2420010, partial [marine sediment metagenome]